MYKKKEYYKMELMLLSTTALQIYQWVICLTMPSGNEERYLWGSYTITFMVSVWGAYLLVEAFVEKVTVAKNLRWKKELLIIIIALIALLGQIREADAGKGIVYLFHKDKDVTALKEKSQIPWIVYGPQGGVYSYFDWFIPEKICFLSGQENFDEWQVLEEIKDSKELILYTGEASLEQAVEMLSQAMNRELQTIYLNNSVNMNVYIVK